MGKISSDMNNDKKSKFTSREFFSELQWKQDTRFVGNVPNERLTYQVGDGKIGAYQADNG